MNKVLGILAAGIFLFSAKGLATSFGSWADWTEEEWSEWKDPLPDLVPAQRNLDQFLGNLDDSYDIVELGCRVAGYLSWSSPSGHDYHFLPPHSEKLPLEFDVKYRVYSLGSYSGGDPRLDSYQVFHVIQVGGAGPVPIPLKYVKRRRNVYKFGFKPLKQEESEALLQKLGAPSEIAIYPEIFDPEQHAPWIPPDRDGFFQTFGPALDHGSYSSIRVEDGWFAENEGSVTSGVALFNRDGSVPQNGEHPFAYLHLKCELD